jgi:uncharacterized protein (TIGR02588 family)
MSSSSPAAPVSVAETSKTSSFEAFLEKNFRSICYAALAIIIGVAVYSILRYRSHQADLAAATAATAAKTVEDCDIVIQKHKGSTAAGNAVLVKASLLWEQNKKDSAVGALRDFVANYKDHPFYVQGLLSLATRLEAMGPNEAKEADSLFDQIVRDHKTSEVAGLAQLRIADRLWSQGKQDEAKKLYDELPRLFPGQFFDENQKRLDWIAAALPTKEVAAPKVPEALKAPTPGAAPTTPGAGIVPPINLKSGGTTMPVEIKAGATSSAQPQIKLETPAGVQPQAKVEPVKPAAPVTTATSPVVEMKLPAPAPQPEAKAGPAPAAPAPAPAAPPAQAPKP